MSRPDFQPSRTHVESVFAGYPPLGDQPLTLIRLDSPVTPCIYADSVIFKPFPGHVMAAVIPSDRIAWLNALHPQCGRPEHFMFSLS